MDVPDRDRSSGAAVGVLGACLGRWGDRLFSLEVLAVPVLGLRGPPPASAPSRVRGPALTPGRASRSGTPPRRSSGPRSPPPSARRRSASTSPSTPANRTWHTTRPRPNPTASRSPRRSRRAADRRARSIGRSIRPSGRNPPGRAPASSDPIPFRHAPIHPACSAKKGLPQGFGRIDARLRDVRGRFPACGRQSRPRGELTGVWPIRLRWIIRSWTYPHTLNREWRGKPASVTGSCHADGRGGQTVGRSRF